MSDELSGTRVAFLATDGVEQVELTEPFDAIGAAGGEPRLVRLDEPAMSFVHDMVASGKPVAAICHGPWALVETDQVRGRTLTSWPSLRTVDVIASTRGRDST